MFLNGANLENWIRRHPVVLSSAGAAVNQSGTFSHLVYIQFFFRDGQRATVICQREPSNTAAYIPTVLFPCSDLGFAADN